MSQNAVTAGRTAAQLYRDCLRMIRHTAGANSPKSRELRTIVAREFRKNADLKDGTKIDDLKFGAVRALSNYLIMQSAMKDSRFKKV